MVTKKKVLVICKSTAGQLYLGILLNRIWYEPVLARNVFDALRLMEQELFSLIILDVPETDRKGALSLLKDTGAPRRLPIIAVLASSDNAVSEQLLSDGCAAVITKPLDISLAYGILGRLSGEMRKTPRVPVRIRVEIAERIPAAVLFSVNISEGGIYLRTPDPLPEDTVLHLSFMLPHDQNAITIAGKVVRNTPLGITLDEEPGMGINFLDISDEVRMKIRNFVSWSLSSDLEWETEI